MAQQQVVDIAALRGIGRAAQDERRDPNRSMDRFMEFAGGVAVQLFTGAFKSKKALNAKNQNFISEKSTDLRDLNPTLKNIVQNEYDEIGSNMAVGTNKKIGFFDTPITNKAKDRSQEGVNILTNEKNRALNIHTDIQNYTKEQKRYYDIHASNQTTDKNGNVKRVTWGQHNLPEDLLFTQFYAEGKLDEFITFDKSSGKLGMNQNVMNTLNALALDPNFDPNSEDVLNAMRAANKKDGEFVIQEDWSLAKEDTSNKGNNINSGILDLTGKNGNVGKYDASMEKRYKDYINTQILGNGDDIAGMNENDIASYFFSKGLADEFVETPTFDVIIDHDGDPNTPDAIFDGENAWVRRHFEDKGYKDMRDLTSKEEIAEHAKWKQGVLNELKTNMDFNSPEVVELLEDDYIWSAEQEHDAIWENSKNNPDNQTPDTKITDWQYKAGIRQQNANNMLESFNTGKDHIYTIGEGANRKERKAVTDTKTNETIIYQRVADANEGTYKWTEVERKSSVDVYNEVHGGEFGNITGGEGYKYTPSGTTQYDEENPVIKHGGTKELRFLDFEKKGGVWKFKTGQKVVKQQDILDQLNNII